MKRPRINGRFVSWWRGRDAKMRDLGPALDSLADAIQATIPRPWKAKRRDVSIYCISITWRKPVAFDQMVAVFYDADLTMVESYDRVRYQVCGIDAAGAYRPLSRAYTSAELTLGQAIETLASGTTLSPDDDAPAANARDAGADDDSEWTGIAINCFLRKDAMR